MTTTTSTDPCRPLALSPTHVHHDLRRRRRRCLVPCLICLLILLALILAVVILAFTLFKPRDPTTTLVSATVSGFSQRFASPTGFMDLNVTLDLLLSVRNPNRVSFAHEPGTSLLYYRGTQVGHADVAAGRMPARGSEEIRVRLTLEEGNLTGDLGQKLTEDAMGGEIVVDASTRIRGKVTFLGFIKFHAVATSECRIAVGVSDASIRNQECKQKTKL